MGTKQTLGGNSKGASRMLKLTVKKPALPVQMALLYLLLTAVDFASSVHMPRGFHESNPYARHMDGSFYPLHAFINGVFNLVGVSVFSAALYEAGKSFDQRVANFCGCLPFIYYGWLHLDAGLMNIQNAIHIYVPTLQEILGL